MLKGGVYARINENNLALVRLEHQLISNVSYCVDRPSTSCKLVKIDAEFHSKRIH